MRRAAEGGVSTLLWTAHHAPTARKIAKKQSSGAQAPHRLLPFPEKRDAIADAPVFGALEITRALRGGDGARTRGPEEPAFPGDIVKSPAIEVDAKQVLKAYVAFERKRAADPAYVERLKAEPFPRDAKRKLEWALAHRDDARVPNQPLWAIATNDNSAALVAYVRAVITANAIGLPIDDALEAGIKQAEANALLDPTIFQRIDAMPFPHALEEQLAWAAAVHIASWNPEQHPAVQQNPRAKQLLDIAGGVLTKIHNNDTETTVVSERRTIEVDGDTRVFAVHTPPGAKPARGWPTVLFFHGSYGGHAPEQTADYQALNAIADRHGFQVIYPVGLPQDRSDLLKTGRGMLNWDPVGAGPRGANDRFVHELLKSAIAAGEVDKARVTIAGHSQGGFYVSDLLAAYPDAFAGAAIFGAGAGSIAAATSFARADRQTPLLLHVGKDDLHHPLATELAAKMAREGYRALDFQQPIGRGHELVPADYELMFAKLGALRFDGTKLGELDGTKASGGVGGKPQAQAVLDLYRPTPELARDPLAMQTVAMLAANPYIDLDGNKTSLTIDEWRTAIGYLHTWPPYWQQQIVALEKYFAPPAPAGQRERQMSRASGAAIETYPGSQAAVVKLERLLGQLARFPEFRELLAKTTVYVSPPGGGLDAIPELGAEYAKAEGVAMYGGFDAVSKPAIAIRYDSITNWDLGAMHELLHLLEQHLGAEDQIARARAAMKRPGAIEDAYASSHEMFAFLGQWYVAGFAHVVEQLAPEVAPTMRALLGHVRIDAGGLTEQHARAAVGGLAHWFRTGVKPS